MLNVLQELSGILDSLYKNKTIDKKLYKVLWHKAKSFNTEHRALWPDSSRTERG